MCLRTSTSIRDDSFCIVLPSAAEWWESIRWVLLVLAVLMAITLAGSFVPYERVVREGHPWLPARQCPGCLFCGMTRSFCAMSSGRWKEASEWNHGGPALYLVFWSWLMLSLWYWTFRVPSFRRNTAN